MFMKKLVLHISYIYIYIHTHTQNSLLCQLHDGGETTGVIVLPFCISMCMVPILFMIINVDTPVTEE